MQHVHTLKSTFHLSFRMSFAREVGSILLKGVNRFGEAAAENLASGDVLPADPFKIGGVSPSRAASTTPKSGKKAKPAKSARSSTKKKSPKSTTRKPTKGGRKPMARKAKKCTKGKKSPRK